MVDPVPKIGLAFRAETFGELSRHLDRVDVLEITVEHWIFGTRRVRAMIEEVARAKPIAVHGVTLSAGTAVAPDPLFLREIRAFLERTDAPWFSEHLAFTKTPRRDLSQLMPLPRTAEMLRIACDNLRAVRSALGVPLVLENVSYYFEYPENEMSEQEFLFRALLGSGSSLLLDVENVRINAANHGYDPLAFVRALPPGIVRAIHVAGGKKQQDMYLDTHDQPVPEDTLRLLAEVLRRQSPETIIVERDRDFGELGPVLEDVRRVREVVAAAVAEPIDRGRVLELQERVLAGTEDQANVLVRRLAEAKRRAKIEVSLPRTQAALGASWAGLIERFSVEHPARSSRNRVNALAFYRFLRRQAGIAPWVIELARCELALGGRVRVDRSEKPNAAFAARCAPGVRLERLRFDIRALFAGEAGEVAERETFVAVFADPLEGDPRIAGISRKLFELLRSLRRWAPIDAGSFAALRDLEAGGLVELWSGER
jgi:hypothetical protein